jgi:hypothetical protein
MCGCRPPLLLVGSVQLLNIQNIATKNSNLGTPLPPQEYITSNEASMYDQAYKKK